MKTIFKKSLVALALVGTVASANAAVSYTGDAKVISKTGLDFAAALTSGNARFVSTNASAAAGVQKLDAVTIALGVAAPTGTLIRVDFSANFAGTGQPSPANSVTPTVTDNAPLATPAVEVYQQGANYVVLRVTSALGANDTIAFDKLQFTAAEVKAKGGLTVTVAAESETDGSEVVASESNAFWSIKSQYALTVDTDLDETIDVSTKRTKFISDDKTAVLAITNVPTAANAYSVNFSSQKFVLTGDFSFIKDTDATTDGIQAGTGVLTFGAGCTLSSLKATELKFGCTGVINSADDTLTIKLDKNAEAKPNADVYTTLAETDFVLSSELVYSATAYGGLSGEKVTPFSATPVGSWTLNGSDVTIPYMVYGTVGGKAYNQVIQLTNKSSIEGAIYVDIYDGEGKAIAQNQKLTAVAKANSVTNIATDIKAIVAAAKYEGKVSVRVISEVPSSSAQIYAAYQDVATSERAIVVGLKN